MAGTDRKGFTIYGGSDYAKIAQFAHPGCIGVKFSPNETYAVSYNGVSDDAANNGHENMIVWNVITGMKLRQFKCTDPVTYSQFGWSFDETFAAAIITNKNDDTFLCIYDSATMNIVPDKEKKKRPV